MGIVSLHLLTGEHRCLGFSALNRLQLGILAALGWGHLFPAQQVWGRDVFCTAF